MTVDDRIQDRGGEDGQGDEVVRLDWRDFGEPSGGVVEAVSRASDDLPTDLPPLHGAVETDALNVLLAEDGRAERSTLRVTFSYASHRITATAAGEVIVRTDGQ